MSGKSTDVPGSIAGYYFQILLGCKELTSCINNTDSVGIEVGADVRIIKSGKLTSVEAKFHKETMGKFNKDIVKTIYNFYTNSANDEELIFITNVAIASKDKSFLVDNWKSSFLDAEKCKYIQMCILKQSIYRDDDCKEKFKLYKSEIDKKITFKNFEHDSDYIIELENEIFGNPHTKKYEDYAVINNLITYKDFIKKLTFIFENKSKSESISDLKNEINQNIKTKYKSIVPSLGLCECNKIRELLVDKFFSIILKNSEDTKLPFTQLGKISVTDLAFYVHNYTTETIDYTNKIQLMEVVNSIEVEENNFINYIINRYTGCKKQELITRYHWVMNEFMIYFSDYDNYNEILKRYSIGKNRSFTSILKIIRQITIISVFKEIPESDITFSPQDTLSNVFLDNVIDYCFKHSDSTNIETIDDFILDFIEETPSTNKLKESQIIVASAAFKKDGRPCERIKEFSTVLNTARVIGLEEDLIYYNSFDYRCDDCIGICGTDDSVNKNLEKFFNRDCRGALK
ncbi:hypothetical protein LL037_23845 [Clostridium estertheticum]|uniref:hypothetical protein n=1 Tax=Clostridium estertheticum TaxID=238834 RepID=UPI001C0E88FF|nr:hypothetical protein [Clostridium estertheticum]MBU3199493.1 hypothetical protein [Clostridium estertheticum]WAG65429.1 hypothetical protein LL037_23845 [Clostridium estertheticum]